MKIAFDASPIRGRRTGVEYYALRLLEALRAAAGPENVCAIAPGPVAGVADVTVATPALPLPLWRQWVLPRALRRAGATSLHVPVTALPLGLRLPVVATVHDLAYLLCPDVYAWRARLTQRFWLVQALRRAAAVVCVSDATRGHLVARHPGAVARIRTIHSGAVALPPPAATPALGPLLSGLEVRTPFVLFVGRIEARKNPLTSVRAFLAATAVPALADHQLVLAGPPGNATPSLLRFLAGLPPAERRRIRLLPHLAPDELWPLYRTARLLLYLSRDEGFGHPPMEALSVGTPVVAADIPVLREVLGDAALFAPSDDLAALAGTVREGLLDDSLRARLLAAGQARLTALTWPETAAAVCALHASLAP